MLCKVAQIRHSFQPLDHSCPCNGVVGILYVKGYTDEVWVLLEHHPDRVSQDRRPSRHQGHLAGLQVFPEGSFVGLDDSSVEDSHQRRFYPNGSDLRWSLIG